MDSTDRADKWLTPKEAARELRVSTRTIVRLCAAGKLSAAHVGRQWRIDRTSWDAYLARKEVNG